MPLGRNRVYWANVSHSQWTPSRDDSAVAGDVGGHDAVADEVGATEWESESDGTLMSTVVGDSLHSDDEGDADAAVAAGATAPRVQWDTRPNDDHLRAALPAWLFENWGSGPTTSRCGSTWTSS